MAKYKVIFRLRCENGVVYNIETGSFELPHKDWYYEHQATVNAMNILLGMADEFKEGNKKIVNYDIVWEE